MKALVKRIFNILWDQNGMTIPFYMEIKESKISLSNFAVLYFRIFATQLISFLERDPKLLGRELELSEIAEYGTSKLPQLAKDVAGFETCRGRNDIDRMWTLANGAPHRYASLMDRRFLVILDEFQNIAHFVYIESRGVSIGQGPKAKPISFCRPWVSTTPFYGWELVRSEELGEST